jgi:hypothetical protein
MRTPTKSLISISLTGFLFLGACGDDGGNTGPDTPDAATNPPTDGAPAPDAPGADPAAALWNAISGANDYTAWAGFPGHEGVAAYTGHGATHRRAFVNDVAAGDLAGMPDGSIIVKENLTAEDPTALAAITVMRKQGADWYWARFMPDGTYDVAGTTAELASAGCVAAACHGDLLGSKDDYVFLNNEAQDAAQIYTDVTAMDDYTAWLGFGTATTPPPVEADASGGAHGAFNRTFLNDIGDGNERNLADGTIIVKENYSPDENTMVAITVMAKITDIDAANENWFYAKLSPTGEVQLAGTLGANNVGCALNGCHDAAAGNDFVFAND